ncbi:hypothetical protein EYC84_011945 [Monilinia fructicola]|uniref:Uncharacterized protein n=1 Tax=Monilinia fructicola TaxID=38448 RepID=A0A5M9J7Y4_MONFR|nr:hypothetical protein EYC84_011945 [Monilinia fructicola]
MLQSPDRPKCDHTIIRIQINQAINQSINQSTTHTLSSRKIEPKKNVDQNPTRMSQLKTRNSKMIFRPLKC